MLSSYTRKVILLSRSERDFRSLIDRGIVKFNIGVGERKYPLIELKNADNVPSRGIYEMPKNSRDNTWSIKLRPRKPKRKKDVTNKKKKQDNNKPKKRRGRKKKTTNDGQEICSIIGCKNSVTNRLRFSLRCVELEEFKKDFLKKGWNKVCHYHYFSDLYKYKKMSKEEKMENDIRRGKNKKREKEIFL